MIGYLSEKNINDLIESGFDLNKIYKDERQIYYVKEMVKQNKNESVLLDESIVLSDVEKKRMNFKKGKIITHFYKTLNLSQLLEYLNENLAGGFKIECTGLDKGAVCCNYNRIYYIDSNEEVEYYSSKYNMYLEELLVEFILYLLKNKEYLL